MIDKPQGKCSCGGTFWFNRYCGADCCDECGAHKGLGQCYCGWKQGGGDGYRELVEMGEQIEENY